MATQKDIYTSAQLLLKKHGKKAEDYVEQMLQKMLRKDDVKAAGIWLSIGSAVEDLRNLSQAKRLH